MPVWSLIKILNKCSRKYFIHDQENFYFLSLLAYNFIFKELKLLNKKIFFYTVTTKWKSQKFTTRALLKIINFYRNNIYLKKLFNKASLIIIIPDNPTKKFFFFCKQSVIVLFYIVQLCTIQEVHVTSSRSEQQVILYYIKYTKACLPIQIGWVSFCQLTNLYLLVLPTDFSVSARSWQYYVINVSQVWNVQCSQLHNTTENS